MRDKYVGYKDEHGTWDMKISEGWLTEELWRVHRNSFFMGVAMGILAGMAVMSVIIGQFQ